MALRLTSSFFSLPIPGDVNDIDILCVVTPKLPLLATEKYQYTSASRPRESQYVASQERSRFRGSGTSPKRSRRESVLHGTTVEGNGESSGVDGVDGQEVSGTKRRNERSLKQQQTSHAGNTGPHEEKSGERDTTEVGGQVITPSEQQSRLAASSSYEPSRFF